MKSFATKVLNVVKQIPASQTLSYKAVAKRAGSPLAARAVGNILKKNFDPTTPCHRVICSDGRVGNYNRGRARKISQLTKEGASFKH